MNDWTVPYTAPGILRGQITVRAADRADAINAAIAAHARQNKRLPVEGGRRRLTLTARERAAISYGEPVAVAAEDAGQVAS